MLGLSKKAIENTNPANINILLPGPLDAKPQRVAETILGDAGAGAGPATGFHEAPDAAFRAAFKEPRVVKESLASFGQVQNLWQLAIGRFLELGRAHPTLHVLYPVAVVNDNECVVVVSVFK